MQACPRVSQSMQRILSQTQQECRGKGQNWVGLSVVHLGDRDVPNALFFIDKYLQVPRILGPMVSVLENLYRVMETPALARYVESSFGSVDHARMAILQDFF